VLTYFIAAHWIYHSGNISAGGCSYSLNADSGCLWKQGYGDVSSRWISRYIVLIPLNKLYSRSYCTHQLHIGGSPHTPPLQYTSTRIGAPQSPSVLHCLGFLYFTPHSITPHLVLLCRNFRHCSILIRASLPGEVVLYFIPPSIYPYLALLGLDCHCYICVYTSYTPCLQLPSWNRHSWSPTSTPWTGSLHLYIIIHCLLSFFDDPLLR